MNARIETINLETGAYFPWMYHAGRYAFNNRSGEFGYETAQQRFENEHNVKCILLRDTIVAIEFKSEAEALMFRLKWI